MEKILFSVKIEVWERDNPFSSQEKYFNTEYPTDYNKEVEQLKEKIKQNEILRHDSPQRV